MATKKHKSKFLLMRMHRSEILHNFVPNLQVKGIISTLTQAQIAHNPNPKPVGEGKVATQSLRLSCQIKQSSTCYLNYKFKNKGSAP